MRSNCSLPPFLSCFKSKAKADIPSSVRTNSMLNKEEGYKSGVQLSAPSLVQEYFQNMVNSSVDNSIKHVRAYVHAYLSDNIKAARSKISGYGEMYTDIMQRALEIKSRSTSLASLYRDPKT